MGKLTENLDKHLDTPRAPTVSLPQYITNIRLELGKVVWPTRKETSITTIMVLVMVFLASLFFFVADTVFSYAIRLILG